MKLVASPELTMQSIRMVYYNDNKLYTMLFN